jgi:hypothetical protein
MPSVTNKTTSGGGLARSAKHLTRTSRETLRAMEQYYKREQDRGRKIPRPGRASGKVGVGT